MVYFMENPIKMHDLGVPFFLETPMWVGMDLRLLALLLCRLLNHTMADISSKPDIAVNLMSSTNMSREVWQSKGT